MKGIACKISYGKTDISYELLILKRKSLEIAVHPDKSIVVKAPDNAPLETIADKVRKRARWIKKQIKYFSQFNPRTPTRLFIAGESHLYLGKKYRLKIKKSSKDQILLKNGYFLIECLNKESFYIKDLLDKWYKQRSKIYLLKIFDNCWASFDKGKLKKPNLKIQKLEKRWGSLSLKNQLILNLNLIQTSKECIEYVIIHELCHLKNYSHNSKFYKILDKAMPDWIKRKHKLEMALI
jgi:predicted metal-dependent hydrolase